jgi:hypothetical protein
VQARQRGSADKAERQKKDAVVAVGASSGLWEDAMALAI